MILWPLAALTVPGLAAYAATRISGSKWIGLLLALAAALWGIWLLRQASGAPHDSPEAVNNILAAFGLSTPATLSALAGTFLARRGRGPTQG